MMQDLVDEGATLATAEIRKAGFAKSLTEKLEKIGLLNNGSSKAPAT